MRRSRRGSIVAPDSGEKAASKYIELTGRHQLHGLVLKGEVEGARDGDLAGRAEAEAVAERGDLALEVAGPHERAVAGELDEEGPGDAAERALAEIEEVGADRQGGDDVAV